jgi:phage terminase Nu1 subunit (DNA packaging protein)
MSKRATSERNETLHDAAEKNLPLTQTEIAAVLQVSKGTIQNYTRQGMPVIYLGTVQGGRGSNPRYRYLSCISWLEKRTPTT